MHRNYKKKLIAVYLISTLLAVIGTGSMLKSHWNSAVENAGNIAVKNIEITSNTVKHILSNGSKLLDFTQRDLQQLVKENKYESQAIQHLIKTSASAFSLDNEIHNYGLVLVTDREGNLIARSDDLPITKISLKDRYYFQALKNNANKKFSIGPLVVARTTGMRIFHFAVPIKDKEDKFNGVLALQINEESVISLLKNNNNEILTAVSENNDIIFTTLMTQLHPNTNAAVKFNDIFQNINVDLGTNQNWRIDHETIVANSFSPALKINYISMQPLSEIRSHFLDVNKNFIYLQIIIQFIFSYLMWFIYKQYVTTEKARLVSTTDPLTQLPNRRAFDERYEVFLREAVRNNSDISVLFIDIDKFKVCNDEYGHENGDLVLKNLAIIIQTCLHRPFDFCCRWGGEELVALLPDTDEAGASIVAQQILDIVRKTPIIINGHPPIRITVSIGIACSHNRANTLPNNNLVDRADQAMYRAKQAGRDRFSF